MLISQKKIIIFKSIVSNPVYFFGISITVRTNEIIIKIINTCMYENIFFL